MHLLVVDDDESHRLVVEALLYSKGHSFSSAESGHLALQLLEQESFDLILLDIVMSNMDGFSTAKEVRKRQGASSHLPIIFLTGPIDEELLVKCLQFGDDYLSKPFNGEILHAKICAHQRIKVLHDELAQHQAQTKREQKIVAHMFENAFSSNLISTDSIRYHLSPMSMFNGDILTTALGPTGDTYIMLGDFTGHGLSAAIGGLPASRVFYAMTAKGLPLGSIVTEINSALRQILPPSMFMCGAIVQIDASGEYFKCWTGGCHDLQLMNAQANIRHSIKSTHLALSILPVQAFDASVETFDIIHGDRLFMYTDGIIEASNVEGEMFGEARLLECIKQSGSVRFEHKPLNYLADAVHRFTQGTSQEDDISIVEILL